MDSKWELYVLLVENDLYWDVGLPQEVLELEEQLPEDEVKDVWECAGNHLAHCIDLGDW